MVVGELRHGQLTIIDRLRETVRLSEGLSVNGELQDAARQRAIDCLSRFGERLHDMHASSVRAAGTSALRRARDSHEFRAAAEEALGHPIEVISGREEARLIYKGVIHSLPPNDGLRLVLDIGGGSTELILGRGPRPITLESLHMGCVLMTETYFPGGRINKASFDAARLAARLKLRPVKAFFRDATELEAIGTSGTINSTEAVARELGVIEADGLTISAVERLIDTVCEFGNVGELKLAGLSDRRAQVWPGGLAILVELLGVLRVDWLAVSDGALREGLLYDYLGRLKHEDARERSVTAMARRFNVDEVQATRVSDTALDLLSQVQRSWNIDSEFASNMLSWAARLHEIGLDISHEGFQQHGAYIAENADMPGFPRSEQKFLAFLIANQRRQIDRTDVQSLPSGSQETALRLAIILRLAVLLNRSRSTQALPAIRFTAENESLEIEFPESWLSVNPLTVADLDRERSYVENVGFQLRAK
jgi:exopolyphosphatase/guanosine-5'-triphosphate,3'-diphosphate pyrophosphatase